MENSTEQCPPSKQPAKVVTVPPRGRRNLSRPTYAGKTALVMGTIQILLGATAVVVEILLIQHHADNSVNHGIWCGCIIVVSGIFTIPAAKNKTVPWVVLSLVISLIATIFSGVLLIASIYDISQAKYKNNQPGESDRMELYVLYILMLITANCAIITAFWTSCLSCKVTCRRQPQREGQPVTEDDDQAIPLGTTCSCSPLQRGEGQQGTVSDGVAPISDCFSAYPLLV